MLVSIGPTLRVQIGFDSTYRRGQGTRPNLANVEYPALVDTGATTSCIDSTLAGSLNLPIVDRMPVSGAHGSQEVNMHLAQIYIPSLEWSITGIFAGVHLHSGGQPHFALIGRTFLSHFTMVYDGLTGSVIISRP